MWTAGRSPSAPPVLLVADGWVLDELAESRLRQQLSQQPESVIGVAARPGPLPPGSTYRATAARQIMLPLSSTGELEGRDIEGAVLLRSAVDHLRRDGAIVVPAEAGRVVVDAGAHVHDPRSTVGRLEAATSLARPPFPSRPVVLFLGCDDDGARTAWAHALVDQLIAADVDACLAVPTHPGGSHLAQPCLAGRRSVEGLAPDVVVTLDDRAAAAVPEWLTGDRLTLIIEGVPDARLGLRLLSWRLGEDRGRVRAQVGEAVEVDELVRAVNRLCSGPHPLPPSGPPSASRGAEEWRDEVGAVLTSIRPRTGGGSVSTRPLTILALDGSLRPSGSAWLDRLAGQLEHSGHAVVRRRGDERSPADLLEPDVLLVHRVRPGAPELDVIDRRRRAGRSTIVALTPDDVEVRPGAGRGGGLSADANQMVRACRWAIAPSRMIADLVDDLEIAVLVVPPMFPESAPSREIAVEAPSSTPAIGWQVDGAPGDELAAVTEAVVQLLDERSDLALQLTGARVDAVDRPPRLAHRMAPGVTPVDRHGWLAQVWTCDELEVRLSGDLAPLVDASWGGVPSLVGAGNPAPSLAAHPRSLVVTEPDDPSAWLAALRPLLVDPRIRGERSSSVVASTKAVFGREGSALVVNRLVGWMRAGPHDDR